jgi:hypothetical protein
MPVPKGTMLEYLVATLEAALSPNARVIRSHKMKDRTGRLREIDLYIEDRFRGRLQRLVVECRNHARPVSIDYIEGLVTKRADLGHPIMCVVSAAGFQAGAEAKAEHHGILLSLFEETTDQMWPSYLQGGSMFEIVQTVAICGLSPHFVDELSREQNAALEGLAGDEHVQLRDENGEPAEEVLELAMQVRGQMSHHDWPSASEIDLSFRKARRVYFQIPENVFRAFRLLGTDLEIAGIVVETELRYSQFNRAVTYSRYRDVHQSVSRGESIRVSLQDGTVVSFAMDPETGRMVMSALTSDSKPAEGILLLRRSGEVADSDSVVAVASTLTGAAVVVVDGV